MKKIFLKEMVKMNGMILLGILFIFLINWNTQNMQGLLWFGFLLWVSANMGSLLGIMTLRKKIKARAKIEY